MLDSDPLFFVVVFVLVENYTFVIKRHQLVLLLVELRQLYRDE